MLTKTERRTSKLVILRLALFLLLVSMTTTGWAQQPAMYYGDTDVPARPYAKDPYVVFFQGTYWMYYSVPSEQFKEWYIGIATSSDLVHWVKKGNLKGQKGTVEEKGICAPGALVKDGTLHLFYQTYGNGKLDAICHATSTNGIDFDRDATNPIFRPKVSDWSCGRAIDAEVIAYKTNYFLYYATRDPDYKIQQQGVAVAPITTNFDRASWTELPDMPLLKPELAWEKKCIEAASCIRKGKYLYMFYAGAYNNEPQQIGVARSRDGVHWKRLSDTPFLTNGEAGSWNQSESGHPNIFKDQNGHYHLFFQGNNDRGKTWYLSKVDIGWTRKGPYVKKNKSSRTE
ncbi:family 43 glycosylhydrolase [Fibrivirga algicola]|uniref:Family 43 glycosylhydrolase n=1 Tax=Fibrivirga algicola TaxID=2950420 RepID=A0ABX0QM93_9BACT|nr:family 43 glycosylhydrolase [Fibrivirga algicola]NID12923.1 family 43 glycosylhydrolase [Fibrivirga algicola]